jgi:hypothetical protein
MRRFRTETSAASHAVLDYDILGTKVIQEICKFGMKPASFWISALFME